MCIYVNSVCLCACVSMHASLSSTHAFTQLIVCVCAQLSLDLPVNMSAFIAEVLARDVTDPCPQLRAKALWYAHAHARANGLIARRYDNHDHTYMHTHTHIHVHMRMQMHTHRHILLTFFCFFLLFSAFFCFLLLLFIAPSCFVCCLLLTCGAQVCQPDGPRTARPVCECVLGGARLRLLATLPHEQMFKQMNTAI